MESHQFRLRELGLGSRIGLACLVLTILGGFAASGLHLLYHHQNRDEQPGVSLEDIKGAYHGVQTTAPLLTSLRRGHPDTLAANEREALTKWLTGNRIVEDFDDPELGDLAPVEIFGRNCLQCHARSVVNTHPIAKTVPLEFFDSDIRKLTVSRKVDPVDIKILAASTHTHALALASLSIVAAGLLFATSWPRKLVGVFVLVIGVSLFADLAAWWGSRRVDGFVYLVIGFGSLYNISMVLAMLAVLIDLSLPRRSR